MELWQALPRIGRCYGDDKSSMEYGGGGGRKQRRKKNDDDGVSVFIMRLRSTRKPCMSLLHASATPKTATTVPRSKPKVAGDVARAVSTVHRIYRIAIRLKFQITPKFV